MENAEQLVEMDSITVKANDIALSELQQPTTNARFGLMSSTKPTSSASAASTWTLDQLTQQLHQIGTFTLASVRGDVPYSFRFNYENTVALFTKVAFNLFLFKSFDINFHFNFISSPQIAGMFAIVYDNLPQHLLTARASSSNYITYYDLRLPRKLVTMGHNSQVCHTLQWNSNLNKLSGSYGSTITPRYSYDMGNLKLVCVNDVKFVTGVSPPSVRIWASISNIQYSGYYPRNQYV